MTLKKRSEPLRSLRISAISALDQFFRRRERRGTQRALRRGIVAAILCGLTVACSNETNTNTPVISAPPTGTTFPMPPMSSASLANLGWEQGDGKRFVFSEFKGKVLILDFYATWCLPCRDSVPHLIGLQKKYEDQGLRVVGLNVGGPGDDQEVPAFAKEFGIQYSLAIPDEDLVSLLLAESDAIPQTFVFDRQGQLVYRLIGFGKGSGALIDRAVETALKTQAP
jgi:thiol-disulfide isomerase/thioredoxin